MAQETGKIVEVDKLTIWVLTDNYFDTLRPDGKITRRYRVTPGKSIHAEHGLAYFVETVVDGKAGACLFDYGLDPVGVLNNIAVLGLDVGRARAFTLSHGHFDHFQGALGILRNNRDRIAPGTPFYVGAEFFNPRYSLRPGSDQPHFIGQLKREELEALGLRVVEVDEPTEVIPGGYLSGNIDRRTPYEKVPPYLLIERGGHLEPDDFRGEQAFFFNVKGQGLVVLSGCAHAGIVNTVRQARKVSGIQKIHAVLGGFHLINAQPEIIGQTVADIKALKPDYVVPTHCTGFEAIVAFRQEMPNEFIINTAGTEYTFAA
jgi:7,8-dihydropterin-6-yl-methyl-4-(beta-D-ribofuranosyl)aminobenzene 5'-phosphate synthase